MALKAAGFEPKQAGEYQQVQIEEEKFGYLIDVSFSKSGEWLVLMAHLAQIPDLTTVPAPALLGLLSANDALLGMAFSYNRTTGQIMLNATVPNRNLDGGSLRNLIEGMRSTVREQQGLWDPTAW